jgi:DNA-binding GntR family transcriptional regulator
MKERTQPVGELRLPLPGRPPRVETKVQAAYREVRARILDGTLEPGTTLNQEALAASLELSTTPLREALRLLEAENLVTLKAHRDMTIAPLTRRELYEVLAVRLQLDPFAAGLAAVNASDEEVETAVRLAATPAPPDPHEQLGLNRAFHRAVYAASGNLLLTQVLDSLWDRTDRYRLAVFRQQRHQGMMQKEHREIAEALQGRDARRLSLLVRRHVESARELLGYFTS